MFFNRIDAFRSQEMITEKITELGLNYRENSYDVKFDLKVNFESDKYYTPPVQSITLKGLRELESIIIDLINFHHNISNAEIYICVAENYKLKWFYDRLVKMYSDELNFKVRADIGEEGLGYEIRTTSYKS